MVNRFKKVINSIKISRIPLPPEDFIQAVGGGDFAVTGQHFFQIFVNQCGLLPKHSVFDIGCGRMAIPLTSYLEKTSEYYGIDIVKPMVKWCVENISSPFLNFKYHHAQLKNSLYGKAGASVAKYE